MEGKPTLDALYELYSGIGESHLEDEPATDSSHKTLTFTSGRTSIHSTARTTDTKPLKLPVLVDGLTSEKGKLMPTTVTVVANSRIDDVLEKKELSDLKFSSSSISKLNLSVNQTSVETQKIQAALVAQKIEGIAGFVHYPEDHSTGCGYCGRFRDAKHHLSAGIFFAGYLSQQSSSYYLFYYDKQSQKLTKHFQLPKPHSMLIAAGHLIWGSNESREVSVLKLDNIQALAEKNIRKSKYRLKHFVGLGNEVFSSQIFASDQMLYFISNSLKTNLWQLVAHEIVTGNEILHEHDLWGNKLASIYILDRKMSILNSDGLVTVLKLQKSGKIALEKSLRSFRLKVLQTAQPKNQPHRDRQQLPPAPETGFTRILHTKDYLFVAKGDKIHILGDSSDKPRQKINFTRNQSTTPVCMKLLPQFARKRTFLMLYDSSKIELHLILHRSTTKSNESWGGAVAEHVASIKGPGMSIHDVGYYPGAKERIAVWGLLSSYPPADGISCLMTFDLLEA